MFVHYTTRLKNMNHSAKNSAIGTSPLLGCNDFMMSSMPMIMR